VSGEPTVGSNSDPGPRRSPPPVHRQHRKTCRPTPTTRSSSLTHDSAIRDPRLPVPRSRAEYRVSRILQLRQHDGTRPPGGPDRRAPLPQQRHRVIHRGIEACGVASNPRSVRWAPAPLPQGHPQHEAIIMGLGHGTAGNVDHAATFVGHSVLTHGGDGGLHDDQDPRSSRSSAASRSG